MSVKSELIELLKTDEAVMIAELMSEEMKKKVLEHEMKRLEELVPFINEGMKDAFEEEDAIVVILDNTVEKELEGPSYEEDEEEAGLVLKSESGQILGETITDEEELEELRDDPNVYFLSENFVTYSNLTKPGEKQFFVIGSTKSRFFTDTNPEKLVSSLTVAIPSTNTDHYIKDCFGLPHDEPIGTLIIGFTE